MEEYNDISIPGIDTSAGIRQCGSFEMFKELLGDVYNLIDKKFDETKKYLADGDLENFTINVHSLKTTCRMIGYTELAESFFMLEQIGKAGDVAKARELAPDVLARFKALKPWIAPFAIKESAGKIPFSSDEIRALLSEVVDATTDFDIDRAEAAASKLLSFECHEALSKELQRLATLVKDLDYDGAAALATEVEKKV